MQSLALVPRTMLVLLGTVVVVSIAQTAVFAPSQVALLWPAAEAALVLSALLGSRRSAIVIKYLFYLEGIALLLSLLAPRPMTLFLVGRRIANAVLLIAVARYLGQSSEVATFYSSKISADAS